MLNKKNKIFITGASGFLGRNVAKYLAEHEYTVIGTDYVEFNDYANWGIKFWQQSNLDLSSLEKLLTIAGPPEAIFHCAGGSSVAFSMENPGTDFINTVQTTSHILEFIKKHDPKIKLIYPSSAAVYGLTTTHSISESTTPEPISPYGTHKLMAEMLCKLYAKNYNIPISIVRFFSLYGNGLKKQILWDACTKAQQNNYSFFGTGEELRDFLHINDAARLLGLAMHHATPDLQVINGGTGKGISIKQLLEKFGNIFTPVQQPLFTSQIKSGDPAHLVADVTRLSAWGFKPNVSIDTGLQDYFNWFAKENR